MILINKKAVWFFFPSISFRLGYVIVATYINKKGEHFVWKKWQKPCAMLKGTHPFVNAKRK